LLETMKFSPTGFMPIISDVFMLPIPLAAFQLQGVF
jgi:hypothetical protein